MADRDFKGIWIPKEVWLSEDLTIMEKIFFVEIDSLDNENGCFASNGYFSKFFKITNQRCSQVIKSLIDKQYVKAKYEYKGKECTKRVLNIFDRGIKFSYRGIKKSSRGYQENVKDNNTSNNTINNIKKGFIKPTIKEIEQYSQDKGYKNIDAEEFWSYYENIGWKIGKNKMKDWKLAAVGWNKRNFNKKPEERKYDYRFKKDR